MLYEVQWYLWVQITNQLDIIIIVRNIQFENILTSFQKEIKIFPNLKGVLLHLS